jgi:endonuclease/exonuclease/phosphatase family metal-dependent hydrolase
MSFNIQHGRRPDGRVDTAALARYVAGCRPDVLALQEVDVGVARSGRVDQAVEVARAAGMIVAFGPACRQGRGGRYGNALLVRGALSDVANLALPRRGRNERRAVLAATAEVDGWRVSVAATHLSVDPGEVRDQLRAALDAVAGRPAPRVLIGDLNLVPADVTAALDGRGLVLADTAAPTFPAHAPRARIDHVAVEGALIDRVEVLDRAQVSDHRALVVELSAP